jgi:hypothetical protein
MSELTKVKIDAREAFFNNPRREKYQNFAENGKWLKP